MGLYVIGWLVYVYINKYIHMQKNEDFFKKIFFNCFIIIGNKENWVKMLLYCYFNHYRVIFKNVSHSA